METDTNKTKKWAPYYRSQKDVWYDPTIPLEVKGVIRLVELHRSDSRGWSLSIRKIAKYLGKSNNTVIKAINKALDAGYLQATDRTQRRRRKLRLSVSLRAPADYESPDSKKLTHWEQQAVSPPNTPTVSTIEPINNKPISTANNNESPLKTEKEESHPYKNEGASELIDGIRSKYPWLQKKKS